MVDRFPGVAMANDALHGVHVCVLGHRGMLGETVARYLWESGCRVSVVRERFDPADPDSHVEAVWRIGAAWYINCIGLVDAARGRSQLMAVNADLPARYSRELPDGAHLVHASSDAVFKDDGACRTVDETPDAEDTYGESKRRAEEAIEGPDRFIIRCSIIGLPSSNGRGLLGWLCRQRGEIYGYVNHCWNGITALEWARVCVGLVASGGAGVPRVTQPGFWPPVTKFKLVEEMADVWQIPVRVAPIRHSRTVTRSLWPSVLCKPIRAQLEHLREWSERGALNGTVREGW